MIDRQKAARAALGLLNFIVAPGTLAALALLCGIGLAITGVFVLFGFGWALIAGAAPLLFIGALLARGVLYGG